MGDLRPLGSEKLEGVAKIKRMIEIATYKETPKNNTLTESKTNTYSAQLADGYTYGIVLEKSGYIIKKGLNENTLDYVDNIRHRKYYRSYSEALKRLNLIAAETNRLNENYEGVSLLGEQPEAKKKFVLKTKKKPQPPTTGTEPGMEAPAGPEAAPPTEPGMEAPAGPEAAPPAEPGMEAPAGPEAAPPAEPGMEAPAGPEATPPAEPGMEGEEGMEAPGMEGEEGMETPPAEPGMEGEEGMEMSTDDEGEEGMESDTEGGDSKVSLKAIQKLTGRLSQKVREYEKEKGMDSQDKKYVLNSLISAINVKTLDDDDRDDIFDKLEQYDEYDSGEGDLDLEGGEMEEPMGGEMEEPTDAEETPTEGGEDELLGAPTEEGSEDLQAPPMAESVEKILSKYFKIDKSEKPILEEKKKKDFIKEKLSRLKVKKEIVKLSENIQQRKKALLVFENENVKFLGKTNKENLVFIKNGKHIKVDQRGRIL